MTLAHSPADIVGKLLEDAGFAHVSVGNEPSVPDATVTVYDTQGADEGRFMDGEKQEHYGVQARVREANHARAFAQAARVAAALDNVYDQRVTLDSTDYVVHVVCRRGQIMSLGADAPATKRRLCTVNALVSVSAFLAPLVNVDITESLGLDHPTQIVAVPLVTVTTLGFTPFHVQLDGVYVDFQVTADGHILVPLAIGAFATVTCTFWRYA